VRGNNLLASFPDYHGAGNEALATATLTHTYQFSLAFFFRLKAEVSRHSTAQKVFAAALLSKLVLSHFHCF